MKSIIALFAFAPCLALAAPQRSDLTAYIAEALWQEGVRGVTDVKLISAGVIPAVARNVIYPYKKMLDRGANKVASAFHTTIEPVAFQSYRAVIVADGKASDCSIYTMEPAGLPEVYLTLGIDSCDGPILKSVRNFSIRRTVALPLVNQ